MSVVISVRVKREIKDRLEQAGINVGEEVRRYLEDLARKVKVEGALKALDALIDEAVKPSPPGFAARSIREDRDASR